MAFLNLAKLPETGLLSVGQTGEKCWISHTRHCRSPLQSLHVATLDYATDVAGRVELLACGGMVAIEYIRPGINRAKLISTDSIDPTRDELLLMSSTRLISG